jgi:hypothetical protein
MEKTIQGGGLPTPMPPRRGGKSRILLIDDDPEELRKLSAELAAPHRELTPVQAKDVKTAMAAYHGHDIVVVDRDFTPKPGWEGSEVTAKIKALRPQTIVIINSAFPPFDVADYCHVKGLGGVHRRGESTPLIDLENMCDSYKNLADLISKIEREQLKLTH